MISSSTSAHASISLLAPLLAASALRSAGIVDPLVLLALRLLVEDGGLHLDEIDDAACAASSSPSGLLDRRPALAPRRSRIDVDAHVEVGADLVHLVDERDARDVVLVGLAPDRLALRLDAVAAVEHRDRAVEHAQAALDLDREVDVAGRVDDVDAVADARVRARRAASRSSWSRPR